MLEALLLAAALLASAGPLAGLASGDSLVGALGDLVPAHHELRGFDGAVSWYAYQPPPQVRYEQPDFETWLASLEPAALDPEAERFVAVWRDAGASIHYVLARGDRVRLFTVDGDRIEFEDPGFQTQAGVARWGWVYRDGLLRTHRTWRLELPPRGPSGRPVGALAPTALYAVTDYEYRGGAVVPSRSRTYWSEQDRQAGRWGQKTAYGPDGRAKRIRHNPQRPYPY